VDPVSKSPFSKHGQILTSGDLNGQVDPGCEPSSMREIGRFERLWIDTEAGKHALIVTKSVDF
jgi:hypothetical protein